MVYVHRRLFKTLRFHETKVTQNPILKPFVIFTFSPHLKRNNITASNTRAVHRRGADHLLNTRAARKHGVDHLLVY